MPEAPGSSESAERRANIRFGLALVCAAALALALMPRPGVQLPEGDAGVSTEPVVGAPVLEPRDALTAFRVAPGLKIALAAAEPTVVAPVAGAFDEDGRLWVVELPTYMHDLKGTGELEHANRVVVLEDTDHDGVFDRSATLLDDLVLPRAVAPCFGGALVLEPPSLYFCQDTDGDGRADVKRKLLDGFGGLDNPEHAANGLLYGIDNWYHFSQHHVDIRFDGKRVVTRATPVIGQWGITQDAWGRLYTTPNSEPLLLDLVPKHYGARNPHQDSTAFLGRSIVPDKHVFPVHPTPGVNRGYQKDVLREDQTLSTVTAACAPVIYDAAALGDGFRGSAIVCEPAGNVLKRYVFGERDHIPVARNAYDNAEMLASPDERFRPVGLVVGPEGALYVLDMYRGIIQHRNFVTPYLAEQIRSRGLQAPLDRGRIYRVTAEGAASAGSVPRLSRLKSDELVRLLGHEDQWWRLTAQRVLVERRATEVAPRLREMARAGSSEAARLHALWTLEGVGTLVEDDALAALADAAPPVRSAGVRLSEKFLASPGVVARLEPLLDDPDRWVRVQGACTLGELPKPERVARLLGVLKRFAGDAPMRDAAISGLKDLELPMLRELAPDRAWCRTKEARYVLDDLADCVLRTSPEAVADLADFTAALASEDEPAAGPILARIRIAQRLDSDKPRPITLAREPKRWLSAMGERFNPHTARMTESEVYFDWPDRPAVRRVHGTRPLTTSELAQFERGRLVYAQTCITCHASTGRGASGQGASLVGSPIAEGPAERLASVLIHGLEGTWKSGELTYEAAMPPSTIADDEELAAVMTFVRRSFGNAGDPVKAEEVAAARAATRQRAKSWTRAEVEGNGAK